MIIKHYYKHLIRYFNNTNGNSLKIDIFTKLAEMYIECIYI